MSQSEIVTTCDCGCGKSAKPHELDRWLTLTQHPEQSLTTKPKLVSDLHFKSIECLNRWVIGALDIIPIMMNGAAQSAFPRGYFRSDKFPTLQF